MNTQNLQIQSKVFATASIASVIFTMDVADRLESLAERSNETKEYIIGCLLFSASAATHPEFLSADRRLASFDATSSTEEQRRCWADAGFFCHSPAIGELQAETPQGSRLVRCFHCGARCNFATAERDPVKLHRRISPTCELARLLPDAAASSSATAGKLHRAVAKLLADLRSSRLLDSVESYGFDRRRAAFTACRMFMRSREGCGLPTRPGDLMQAMHDAEVLLEGLPEALDLEAALTEAVAARDQPAPAQALPTPPPPPPQSPIQSKPKPPTTTTTTMVDDASKDHTEDADEKCVLCRLQVRDQVTLPCAHFLLCRGCVAGRRDCPKCSREILGTVRAFVA